jgi:hypothetical protein
MEARDFFNYGVPTGLLCVLMFGLWKIVLWAKKDVVKPVLDSHLKLIKTLNDHIPKQTEQLEKQTDILNGHTKLLEDRTSMFDRIINNQGKIIDVLDEMKKDKP